LQTYNNYGFTLYNINNLPLEKFNEISGLVNQICLKAKQACEHSSHEALVISFVIEKNSPTLGSLYICGDNVSFGIVKGDSIQRFCDAKELEDYCNSPAAEFMPSRIHNQLKLVLDKKIAAESLSFQDAKELWEKHYCEYQTEALLLNEKENEEKEI